MAKLFFTLICISLLWSCAAEGPVIKKEPVVMAGSGTVSSIREPSAEELLQEASAMLALPDRSINDYQNAHQILNRLIQSFPDSTWRTPAEALLLLIDHLTACTERNNANHINYEEILSQKRKCEESENQCRQELTRILQENEQLKKDLQDLKKLEIELEQRNRALR